MVGGGSKQLGANHARSIPDTETNAAMARKSKSPHQRQSWGWQEASRTNEPPGRALAARPIDRQAGIPPGQPLSRRRGSGCTMWTPLPALPGCTICCALLSGPRSDRSSAPIPISALPTSSPKNVPPHKIPTLSSPCLHHQD